MVKYTVACQGTRDRWIWQEETIDTETGDTGRLIPGMWPPVCGDVSDWYRSTSYDHCPSPRYKGPAMSTHWGTLITDTRPRPCIIPPSSLPSPAICTVATSQSTKHFCLDLHEAGLMYHRVHNNHCFCIHSSHLSPQQCVVLSRQSAVSAVDRSSNGEKRWRLEVKGSFLKSALVLNICNNIMIKAAQFKGRLTYVQVYMDLVRPLTQAVVWTDTDIDWGFHAKSAVDWTLRSDEGGQAGDRDNPNCSGPSHPGAEASQPSNTITSP